VIKRLLFGVSVWLVFLVGSSVAVAGVWSAPVVLQPNVNVAASAVDSAGGQTVAAWEGNTGVWTAVSEPVGGFFEQRLSSAKVANVSSRLLVVDSRGDAVVAWETRALPSPTGQGLPPGTLWVAYRPAGERFGRPRRLARFTEGADLGIDRRGVVTIVWDQAGVHGRRPGLSVVERLRNGRYGRARRVVAGSVLGFSLAMNGRDDAALVWEQGTLDSSALLCATRRRGREFGRAVDLVGAGQGAGPFDVGIDSAGRATVAWEGPYDGAGAGSPFRSVNTVTVDVGAQRPGSVQRLRSPGGGQLGDGGVRVVVDPRGDATAVWDTAARGARTGPGIVVARRRPGHRFAAGRKVGTGDTGGGFDAAIASTGALLVAWQSNYEIRATFANGPRDPLGQPSQVSPPQNAAADPTVALNSHGQSLVLWQDLGPNAPGSSTSNNTPLLLATTTSSR
jgi:hypothetical protein